MADNSLSRRVLNAKKDKAKANELIGEYRPFIASVVQNHLGRYVEYGVDDELSVALVAFHEAIQKYDIEKGSFLSFARVIIKHRLIDYHRKEDRVKQGYVYIKQTDDETDEDTLTTEALKDFRERQLSDLRRVEILEIKKDLSKWGITFADVAKSSPKREGTRQTYIKAIEYILNNPEVLDIMKQKRYLPVEKIVTATKIPRKKIERGRNYIVAAVLILSGDYQYIKDYIQWR
jgi:RNA polymerase sigma factor